MTARERLRGLAEAANSGLALRVETLAFRDAASPSVVLGLLGELEEAERAVRDTYLAINHKAVKTAEIRPIARLAAMLREQMDDMRYTDIVEVLQDFYAVAEAVGAVHEQSMGKPHPGTREEVVSAIESLKARIAELEARLAGAVEISQEDARIWSAHPDDLSFTDNTEVDAALRINAALRSHAKGVDRV